MRSQALTVSKSQKQISKFLFESKNKQKYFVFLPWFKNDLNIINAQKCNLPTVRVKKVMGTKIFLNVTFRLMKD